MFSFDPAQERRSGSYPRVPCQREVALSGVSDHDVMSGQLCDLGPGGVAVRSPGALPAGASLRCSFADPESGTSIQLSCQVAWCAAPEAEGEEGTFGLRFVDVAPPAAAALHALLAAEQRAPQPVWRPGQAVHVQVEGAEHAERLAVSHSDAESLVLEKALTGASLGAAATLAAVGEGAVETEQGRVSAVSLRMHHELPVLQLRVERSAPEPARTVDWSVPPHMADAGWAEAPAAAETPLPLADTVRPSDWPAPASLSMPTDIDEDAPTPALSAPRGTVAPLPWRGDDAAAPVAQDDTDGPVTVPDPIQLVPAAAVLQEMDSPDAVTPSPWPRRLARLQAQLHGVGQRWQQGVAAVAGGWARLWAALVLMGLRLRAWGRALGRQMWLRLAALRRPAALRGARTVTRSATLRKPRLWSWAQRPPRRRSTAPGPGQVVPRRRLRAGARKSSPRLGRRPPAMHVWAPYLVAALSLGVALYVALRPEPAAPAKDATARAKTGAAPTLTPPRPSAPDSVRSPATQSHDLSATAPAPLPPRQVPGDSPYAVDRRSAAEAGQDPTSMALQPAGSASFGDVGLRQGRRYRLRMSAPVRSLRGLSEADGFVVAVGAALALDRASPIAEQDPDVERAIILNRGDHSVLQIKFVPGRRPRFRVVGRGEELEILLGAGV